MSATGYNDMLQKYRDVDEDAIMSGLTEDELARLENEIDREILEKPPEYDTDASDMYTTTTTTTDEESESEEAQYDDHHTTAAENTAKVEKNHPTNTTRTQQPTTKNKSDAFNRGKLDKTQLKPVTKTLQRQRSLGSKHTFKLPALKKTQGHKADKRNPTDDSNCELKDELIQAVKKRDKRRTRRGNSSGVGAVRRLSNAGLQKARRNSKIARYRDGNEHQVDASNVNRNFITDEMMTMRPRLRKVQTREPKLVLPDELHGVSFKRITAGAKKLQEEEEAEAEANISEDGDASRNSAFGGYDADNDVTPSLSDESYVVLGDECDAEEEKERQKALSECSEAPSDGVMTMASNTSTSAESCDVFGELSINPNSVEEMVERVAEDDPMLTEVNLNNIHDVPIERFEELAEAMVRNTHVTSLMLANTGLTDRAAKAMAAMLKRNSTLKKLNLESNFITGEGARRLVSALRKNTCLVELLLDNQRHIFGAKVEFEIAKLLKENTSLLKFGYQFANPGPRMATSNILTKNMDIVRKKRVAEEKKRQQSGQSKRPTLRRQPSSEWYRKERLQRLKNLQEQSKLLGLDKGGQIGEGEVEKVLQNMDPEQVSLLERWFTSKLLGMVDKPPTARDDEESKMENKPIHRVEEQPKKEPSRGRKETKTPKPETSTKPKDNLLRPPPRKSRSKSPVASRDDLMDSIRKQNTKLKKVQVRPFESPTYLENMDSDVDIRPAHMKKAAPSAAPDKKQTDLTEKPTQAIKTDKKAEEQRNLVKPTILKTEPSFDRDTNVDANKLKMDAVPQELFLSNQGPTGLQTDDLENDSNSRATSSSEIREWKEGEEYDSDEYEIVEVEVTDSEEGESELNDDAGNKVPEEDFLHSTDNSNEHMRSSPKDTGRDTNPPSIKPDSFNRFRDSDDFAETGSYKTASSKQSPTGKPESPHCDAEEKRRNFRLGSTSPTSLRSTLRSPLSPSVTAHSPTFGGNRLGIPRYNGSTSPGSAGSSDSAKSGSRFATRNSERNSRPGQSRVAEEEPKICPKALSTIESFFAFK